MPQCPGKNKSAKCYRVVFRCKKCSAAGCEGTGCTNQKFDPYRCMSCGSMNTKEQLR